MIRVGGRGVAWGLCAPQICCPQRGNATGNWKLSTLCVAGCGEMMMEESINTFNGNNIKESVEAKKSLND